MKSSTRDNSTSHHQTENDWISRVTIRPGNRTDLPQMEWDGEFTHLRKIYANTYERSRAGLARIWVAEIPEHGVIGQVLLQLKSNREDLADGVERAYLFSFRIKPQFRGLGLGALLLTSAENDVQQKDFAEMTLIVSKENLRAIQFYRRHDYRILASESGEWIYSDHNNLRHKVIDPGWKMMKMLKRY